VAAQYTDPSSTLHLVRELIALRKATPALGGRAETEVVCAGYPLAYVRGGSHLVVVNPREEPASVAVPGIAGATVLFGRGVTIEGNDVTVDGFGYAVLALA
jgi:maltose alpha-D-glucosyltransferase/alpha-amylase